MQYQTIFEDVDLSELRAAEAKLDELHRAAANIQAKLTELDMLETTLNADLAKAKTNRETALMLSIQGTAGESSPEKAKEIFDQLIKQQKELTEFRNLTKALQDKNAENSAEAKKSVDIQTRKVFLTAYRNRCQKLSAHQNEVLELLAIGGLCGLNLHRADMLMKAFFPDGFNQPRFIELTKNIEQSLHQ